uniref:G-protein coupled receptors family 1 profile domain-containing protein n=1 Tax=Trichobilharzia regenti TaxID=157069 RepID=A0AA85KP02_TRIRE|nr:unnamed protein product [Trichobilharzia regenti]
MYGLSSENEDITAVNNMNNNKSFDFIINDECNQTWNFTEIITSPSIIISFCIASTINLWIFGSCLFVIIILLRTKNKRFDATRKFLINLAITDIGFACLLMPISIAYIILKVSWIPCHILCHLWIIADVYFCSTNMFNLVVIALDRMMAVNYAVKYNQMMSNTRFNQLVVNKRGISIGLLIDNESVCNKKSDKKCSTISKSTNAADTKISTDNPEKKNNTSDDQGDANNNNNDNNNNGNNNNNKSNAGNKRNYKSNCGLLRVHVGGRPFQTNHISNTPAQTALSTPTTATNQPYHSSTSINKSNDDTLNHQQQQQDGNDKKNGRHASSVTLNSSIHKSSDSEHQHLNPRENQSQLCITTGLVRKKDMNPIVVHQDVNSMNYFYRI